MILLELGDLCGRNPDHLVQFRNLSFMVNNSFIEMSRSRLRRLEALEGPARCRARRQPTRARERRYGPLAGYGLPIGDAALQDYSGLAQDGASPFC